MGANERTVTVLLCYGERRRPVKLSSSSLEELRARFLSAFSGVLPKVPASELNLLFQVKDESWGGEFVDIVSEEAIEDRSVVRETVEGSPYVQPTLPISPQVCF